MNSKPDSGVCWPARGSECSKGASLWALGWPTYWSVVHDLGSRVAQCWGLPPLMPPGCGLWAVSGFHLGVLVLDASPASTGPLGKAENALGLCSLGVFAGQLGAVSAQRVPTFWALGWLTY